MLCPTNQRVLSQLPAELCLSGSSTIGEVSFTQRAADSDFSITFIFHFKYTARCFPKPSRDCTARASEQTQIFTAHSYGPACPTKSLNPFPLLCSVHIIPAVWLHSNGAAGEPFVSVRRLCCPERGKELYSLLLSFTEPKVAPFRVMAKAVLSSEMDVSWEPVEQGDMTGVLLGYEVRACNGKERY